MKRITSLARVITLAGMIGFFLVALGAQTPGAFRQEGIASVYGAGLHGRVTSSGEIHNADSFTAAHPSLPFGTILRVTNRHNSRTVTVRVNDRGPVVPGRIIELSRAAAAALDISAAGTAPVLLEEAAPVQAPGLPSYPQSQAPMSGTYRQEGIASVYGPGLHGRVTSSGEIHNNNEFTAAHPSLPFGTVLRVTNRHNSRTATVRVNDRGPVVPGRIIELSQAAAIALDIPSSGTAQVLLEQVFNVPLGSPHYLPAQPGAPQLQEAPRQASGVIVQVPAPVPQAAPEPTPVVVQITPPSPATVVVQVFPQDQDPPTATSAPPAASPGIAAPAEPPADPPARLNGAETTAGRNYVLIVDSYQDSRRAITAYDQLKEAGLDPSYMLDGDEILLILERVQSEELPSTAQTLGTLGIREVTVLAEGQSIQTRAISQGQPMPQALGRSPSPGSSIAPAALSQTVTAPQPIFQGNPVPGLDLGEKLTWLAEHARSNTAYIIEVGSDERIEPHTFDFPYDRDITIILRGIGAHRTISLSSDGSLFTIHEGVSLILDNNIILQGHDLNTASMVLIQGGTLRMNSGSAIRGNTRAEGEGGAVAIHSAGGSFEMNGGTISGNSAMMGGGVAIYNGSFTMNGGTISGNRAALEGGGVYAANFGSTVLMQGGTITGNSAESYGGGLRINGGGVTFTKTGGTITGYSSDSASGNVVRNAEGIIPRRGHGVFVNPERLKESTAGTGLNLNSELGGGWD
ncbi:MAG: septal ring lytic transglycosylase RlpA family protein [Treponema sp.]|nr:septal ring lytic transglycosylase RlpA family protein [Treponema sp.]